MNTFMVYSNHGQFTVNAETGDILEREKSEECDWDYFDRLTKFDIEEYKKYYGVKEIHDTIDILSIGYWYKGTRNDISLYEEPAHDWRELVKED